MNIAELSRDDERLKQLEIEYAKLNLVPVSAWKEWAQGIDIQNFRAEHGYMAQMWNMTEGRYQNTYDYALSLGMDDMLKYLGEDGAFGCVTFERDGVKFSRDLLDSAFEIRFLEENLGLRSYGYAGPNVLDIGAGYGRFAHRLVQWRPEGTYVDCVDAVPLSTYLCRYYLQYRGVHGSSCSVPLHKLGVYNAGLSWPIDLACNMQSFSEMPLAAVDFWLGLCAAMNIPYFFLEPHSGDLVHPHYVTTEVDGTRGDYYPLFAKHGYKLKVQQPKFPRDLAPNLIYATDFLLFERG